MSEEKKNVVFFLEGGFEFIYGKMLPRLSLMPRRSLQSRRYGTLYCTTIIFEMQEDVGFPKIVIRMSFQVEQFPIRFYCTASSLGCQRELIFDSFIRCAGF